MDTKPNLYCYVGRKRSDPHAVKLRISDEDMKKFGNLPKDGRTSAVVTDLDTQRKWKVKWAPCSFRCYCAAEATPVPVKSVALLSDSDMVIVMELARRCLADGDWPQPMAKELTEMSHPYGSCDIYVGDDGRLYV